MKSFAAGFLIGSVGMNLGQWYYQKQLKPKLHTAPETSLWAIPRQLKLAKKQLQTEVKPDLQEIISEIQRQQPQLQAELQTLQNQTQALLQKIAVK